MKRLAILIAMMMVWAGAACAQDAAGVYRLAEAATSVTFTTGAFGVAHTTGRVAGVDGTLTFDPGHPDDSAVDVTLDMTTLSTGVGMFDEQLQGEDYFDTAHYPSASFRSTRIEMTGEKIANVTGDMTLHGVTRTVILTVVFDQEGGTGMEFTATARIHRRDFGIDKFQLFISDDIDLHIRAEVHP